MSQIWRLNKVIRTHHQRTVHHGTLCITLLVVISNVVALSSAALMINGKLIWLTCQMRKCSMTVTRSCWLSLKSFLCMSWAAEEQNRRVYSQSLCKNSKQKRAEDVVICKRTVVSCSPTSFYKIHFLTAKKHETKSSITERMIRTLWSRIWRYFTFKDTERYVDVLPDFSRSYNATFHHSMKRSDHWWLSQNQPAIVQQIDQARCSL